MDNTKLPDELEELISKMLPYSINIKISNFEKQINSLNKQINSLNLENKRLLQQSEQQQQQQNSDNVLQEQYEQLKKESEQLKKEYEQLNNKYNKSLTIISSQDKFIANYEEIIFNNSEPDNILDYKYGKLASYSEDRDSLIKSIKTTQIYQPHVIKMFQKHVRPNTIVLDIGANIGIFTLAFAKLMPSCHVHAFEMMPKTYKALQKTVEINQLKNVTLHQIGLYHKKTNMTVNYKPYMLGKSFITEDKEKSISTVECDTLDSFKLENVSFIKIDIQGGEYDALCGSAQTLKNSNCIIVAEFSKEINSLDTMDVNLTKFNKTVEFMKSIGYKVPKRIHDREYIFKKQQTSSAID